MFAKILIANRGEIAVRIACACREMGIGSVAVYSEADRDAPHVLAADEARCVGPAPSVESYLNREALLQAAAETSADAVHPGYGFLAENADFAAAVRERGLTFIGPRPEAIAAMGDKTAARVRVAAAGVPVAPAVEDPPVEEDGLRSAAARLGYPLLIKAAAGGGGKGMRIVHGRDALIEAHAAAAREACAAFGDGRVFLEHYIERPRHIEVQILADTHGNLIHLGERECSIQRRHQKIVEETPSPAVDAALRTEITEAALAVARSVSYTNAGTVEFLLAPDRTFFFLEMNTRLQVEHPITEWVYGVDLVQAQIRIAAGEPLSFTQADVRPRGHAIECRIYAEDPAHGFLPCPGRIDVLEEPRSPGVRVDSGVRAGSDVPLHYDPMLAKLSVHGEDREQARRRMVSALRQYAVLGVTTSIPFLADLIEHPAFVSGDTQTHFIDDHMADWNGAETDVETAAIAAALFAELSPRSRHATTAAFPAQSSPWQELGGFRLGQGKRKS